LVGGFLTRPTGIAELAKAVDGKNIPDDIRKAAITVINASGRHEEAARAFSGKQNRKPIVDESFAAKVRNEGDVKRGAEVYNRGQLGCSICHKVNGQGGAVGPELSALGTAQPIEFIARAILEPQKEIKEGFTSVLIAMKNGDEFQGYVVRETADEILLRQPLLNQEIRLRRSEIGSNRSNGSLMPAGLADQLSDEEFRDLVKYLSTLGKP
jgi:putative heme-binding domain-containing protein